MRVVAAIRFLNRPLGPRVRGVLSVVVIVALVAYCAWWGYWLARGMLPMAPIKALVGLPAPSTGCMRSLDSLARGQIVDSLLWNPFCLPLTALFVLSIVWVAVRLLQRERLVLPSCFLPLWVTVLALAWVA